MSIADAISQFNYGPHYGQIRQTACSKPSEEEMERIRAEEAERLEKEKKRTMAFAVLQLAEVLYINDKELTCEQALDAAIKFQTMGIAYLTKEGVLER